MNNYFVILAAGKSKRFHKNKAKQFFNYKNKEIIDHSIEKSLNSKLFKKILIVTNNLNHLKEKKYPKSISIIKMRLENSALRVPLTETRLTVYRQFYIQPVGDCQLRGSAKIWYFCHFEAIFDLRFLCALVVLLH